MNLKSLIPVGRSNALAVFDKSPLNDLQREIERLFENFTRDIPGPRLSALVPKMDVCETDADFEISAELPGLEEKDVQINFADGLLTIRGEKKSEKEEKDKNYHLVERNYGSFERTLQLPAGVDADSIKATIANGVLTVKVPKPAAVQPKKIDVKAAA